MCEPGVPRTQRLVVAYVNTAAAVKRGDYCCTSGNAVAVINALPPDVRALPSDFTWQLLRKVTAARSRGRRVSRACRS